MAMVAALEDKVVDENTMIATGKGELTFFKRFKVRDSKKGGYGTISAAKVFEVSSNTGMVKIIHDNYGNTPEKFVNRLYNMGINKPLGLPISGEIPKIAHPMIKTNGTVSIYLGWPMAMESQLPRYKPLPFIMPSPIMVKWSNPRFIEKIDSYGEKPDQSFGKITLNPFHLFTNYH